jgi:hypothetical protein
MADRVTGGDVWRWWRKSDRQWCGTVPADGLFVIGLAGLLTLKLEGYEK